MTNPIISVVLPYYKNANTIVRALNSIFSQTLQDFEILLINDASPDWAFAAEAVEKFKNDKLKIYHHPKNCNGAAARNTGIKNASGIYIAFLDADDEWNQDHLEKSLNYMESDEAIDLAFSKFLVKSNMEYILPNCMFDKSDRIGDFLFVKQQAIFTPSFFVKASIAKQISFNSKLRRHQDYDFLLRFEASGFRAGMSEHVGGIVHWENNDLLAKGGTWQNSLKWSKDNRVYFSDKAYTNFVIQFVVAKLLKQHCYRDAIEIMLKECNLSLITKKNVNGILYPILNFIKISLTGKNKIVNF